VSTKLIMSNNLDPNQLDPHALDTTYPEFVSTLPANTDDEDGYEEFEDDDEGYDEDDEISPPSKAGNNLVRTVVFGLAGVLALGGGGYLVGNAVAPDMMNDVLSSVPFLSGGEQSAAVEPPAEAPVTAPTVAPAQTMAPMADKPLVKPKLPKTISTPTVMDKMPIAAVVAPEKPALERPAAAVVRPKPKPRYQARPVATTNTVRIAQNNKPYISEWRKNWLKRRAAQQNKPAVVAKTTHPQAMIASSNTGRYVVQVGVFRNAENANSLVQELNSKGIPASVSGGGGSARSFTSKPVYKRVKRIIEVPETVSSEASVASTSGDFLVRSIAVRDSGNAEHLKEQFQKAGYEANYVKVGSGLTAVAAGRYSDSASAAAAVRRLSNAGLFATIQASGGSSVAVEDNSTQTVMRKKVVYEKVLVSPGRTSSMGSTGGATGGVSRVVAGRFRDRASAVAMLNRLNAMGVKGSLRSY
jgi:cell division protein FtsN